MHFFPTKLNVKLRIKAVFTAPVLLTLLVALFWPLPFSVVCIILGLILASLVIKI